MASKRTDADERVVAEVADKLRRRGVTVTGAERSDDLADLLTAVERFEAAVEAHGGDLMVDDLNSPEPDDQHFVLPRRAPREAIRPYIARIETATVALRQHPPHPD